MKRRLRHTVLVTLKSGHSFRGVLNEQDKQAVVLCNAEMADPRSDRKFITADGEIVLLVVDIAYMQFV